MREFLIYGSEGPLEITIEGGENDPHYYNFEQKKDNRSCHKGIIVLSSISTGIINLHCIWDTCWSFAICPQNDNGQSLPPNWKIFRKFGDPVLYSETIRIIGPDDLKHFLL